MRRCASMLTLLAGVILCFLPNVTMHTYTFNNNDPSALESSITLTHAFRLYGTAYSSLAVSGTPGTLLELVCNHKVRENPNPTHMI